MDQSSLREIEKQATQAAMQRIIRYGQAEGRMWNKVWGAQTHSCVSCEHVLAAAIQTEAGHLAPPTEATAAGTTRSEIHIRPGLSRAWTTRDSLDLRPFVAVEVRRSIEGSDLAKEERIRLTPEEWLAVIGQLQGPLSVLLKRKPWWEDHT